MARQLNWAASPVDEVTLTRRVEALLVGFVPADKFAVVGNAIAIAVEIGGVVRCHGAEILLFPRIRDAVVVGVGEDVIPVEDEHVGGLQEVVCGGGRS